MKRAGAAHACDYVVVGLGASGLSCARFLARQGLRVAVTDTRAEPPGRAVLEREQPQVTVRAGDLDTDLIRGAATVVLSPGIARTDPRLAAALAGVEVVGDIELFARHADAPVVAVTGSNGKSTVTTLVGTMFRTAGRDVRVGGNLGPPALDLLGGPPPDAYLLELSSFQLETTYSLNAAVAALLNVSPDHLDRYAGLDEYVAAKARVFLGDGAMVLNAEDPRVAALARPRRRTAWFGLTPDRALDYGLRTGEDETPWLHCRGEPVLPVAELGIRGRHNVANALAALAIGDSCGLPRTTMAGVLRGFEGLPHRCRRIASVAGVDWIDDSKGTNVGATCAAIAGMEGYGALVLIAGGQGKGQDFGPLLGAARGRLRAAVLIGCDAPRIAAVLDGTVSVVTAVDMDAAVAAAAALAAPGDAVLLSPACASFDMFTDYAARGAAFAAAVARLGAQP